MIAGAVLLIGPTILADTSAMRIRVIATVVMLLVSPAAVAGEKAQARAIAQFERETGMEEVVIPGTDGLWMGKEHRGYPVLFTAKAGDVWGRYAARLAMAEIGREVGGVLAFLTGSGEWMSGPAGSTLDRLLARAIGQPLSITVILEHDRAAAPRLDIYPGFAVIKPDDELPKVSKVSMGAGHIRSHERAFAVALASSEPLMKRLKRLRGQYIRVDGTAVTLFWSGQEKDFAAMIRDHGDYWKMLAAMLDDLADIAERLPAPVAETETPPSPPS